MRSVTHPARGGEARSPVSGLRSPGLQVSFIRHPAKLRLAQLLAEDRRHAKAKGDLERDEELAARIRGLGLQGGLEDDIHVYLTWDTDRTDVDLWVVTPSGEKEFYSHREGKGGEALFDDVTSGYGPESFTAKRAAPGEYRVQVNYFGGRRGAFAEARGEVIVVARCSARSSSCADADRA